jgi:hypothetical protein
MGLVACAAGLDTSRRRTDPPVSARGSSLSAIVSYGRRETVGLLASRAVQEVR